MHALLTAYVVWLTVRSFHRDAAKTSRLVAAFVFLVAALALTTSFPWYVCVIMPDILGPDLYLAIYLLVFARETLTTRERIAVGAIAFWAMTAHSTHLMLAVFLCLLLALLALVRFPADARSQEADQASSASKCSIKCVGLPSSPSTTRQQQSAAGS